MSEANQTRQRIIFISQNRIYITPNIYFILEETNFPHENFAFRSSPQFYWEIELLSFDKANRILSVKVSNYYPVEHEGFEEQTVKMQIDQLVFCQLEWDKFSEFLAMYRKNDLTRLLI